MRIPRPLVISGHAVSAAFLGFGVVFPLLSAIFQRGATGASGTGFASLLLDPVVLQAARFTSAQAGWSLLFSIALGLPVGLWVRGGRRVEALLALPFGIPTLVV